MYRNRDFKLHHKEIERTSWLERVNVEKVENLTPWIDPLVKSQSFDLCEGKAISLTEINRGKNTKTVLKKIAIRNQVHTKSKKVDQGIMTQSSNHSSKPRANSLINSDLVFEIGDNKY